MRFLSIVECAEWCAAHGIMVSQGGVLGYPVPDIESTWLKRADFPLPADSGKKVALAKSVFHALEASSECLLWIANWSVWPSSAHRPLFTRVRQALGENADLAERPGHLAGIGDLDDAVTFLVICMTFFWDCYVLPSGGRKAFFTSHDEWFALLGMDDETVQKLRGDLCYTELSER
jgi:hypothetical protein